MCARELAKAFSAMTPDGVARVRGLAGVCRHDATKAIVALRAQAAEERRLQAVFEALKRDNFRRSMKLDATRGHMTVRVPSAVRSVFKTPYAFQVCNAQQRIAAACSYQSACRRLQTTTTTTPCACAPIQARHGASG